MTTIEAEEEWSTGVDDTMRLHRSATWPSFTREIQTDKEVELAGSNTSSPNKTKMRGLVKRRTTRTKCRKWVTLS